MNFLITSIGVSAAMSTVTATTSFASTIYSLAGTVRDSTDSGLDKIKTLIEETDIENDIKIISEIISEIDEERSSDAVKLCIKSINESLNDIKEELDKIQYRVNYNNNMTFSAFGTRSYGFANCHKRLKKNINVLNKRFARLRSIHNI